MLAPGGLLLATIPLGYNAYVDALSDGSLRFDDLRFLRRVSRDNRWLEVVRSAVSGARCGSPFPKANALAVGSPSDVALRADTARAGRPAQR